jgi:hypothetical protein
MEIHSPQSLYAIHGLSIEQRRRRSRLIGRLLIARIAAFLTRVKWAIGTELAIRRATAELTAMDDRMLRDLGIQRSEIGDLLRRPPADVEADDATAFSSNTAQSQPALPTVNSPRIAIEGRPEQSSPRRRSPELDDHLGTRPMR